MSGLYKLSVLSALSVFAANLVLVDFGRFLVVWVGLEWFWLVEVEY